MALDTYKLTVAQFWEQYAGQNYELIDGTVMEMAPAGIRASAIARRIAARLGDFVDANNLGEVTAADGGFMLDEDNRRAPDAAFFSKDRLRQQADIAKYSELPPDLAVEVVSFHDCAADVRRKIDLYLASGVRLVCVVYPETRKVTVHHPNGSSQTLDGETVLPGFSLPIASILPAEAD